MALPGSAGVWGFWSLAAFVGVVLYLLSVRFPRHKPHQLPPFLPLQSPHAGVTLAVPGYRQSRNYTCGFAATLMVARFFEPQVSAFDLYHRLGTSRDGTRQTAIVRELRSLGVSANTRYDVDYNRVVREVDRGKLIIGYLFDDEHWLVVYGYAQDPDRVFVADPRPGHPCEYVWSSYGRRLGRFGIVCSAQRRRGTGEMDELAEEPRSVIGFRMGASERDGTDSQLELGLSGPSDRAGT